MKHTSGAPSYELLAPSSKRLAGVNKRNTFRKGSKICSMLDKKLFLS
jgi:hypothetical protein